MIDLVSLSGFAALALAGSLHCAGMCGAFALASARAGGLGRRAAGIGLYSLGKSAAYAAQGALVSLAAHAASLAFAERGLAGVSSALAWLAAALLIGAGLAQMGLRLRSDFGWARALLAVRGPVSSVLRALPPRARSFGLGFLNGFLPCGLSWSAFALATQVDPPTAALGLLAFGAATTPALGAVGLGELAVPLSVRRRARWLVGPALVALGLLTLWRGGLPWGTPGPACCRSESAAASLHPRS